MITTLTQLPADTLAAARAWLSDSRAAIEDATVRADVTEELTAALLGGLDPDSTPEQLARLVARIGPVRDQQTDPEHLVGSIVGVPFDLRPPTADRIRRTWWDPTEPRILVPRVFGLGWAVNFGALAVRARLIEPDAENEPFADTPQGALRAALALPVLLTGVTVLHYLRHRHSLPQRLPNHWDAAGRPDGWTSLTTAVVSDIAMTAGPTALAVGVHLRGRPPQRQAGVLAAAAMTATAGALVARMRSAGDRRLWWAGPALAASMVGAAGLTLLGLARAGRAAEQRRDLAGAR